MVKFEKEEMVKKRPHVKNTWYNWLFNYTPKPILNGRRVVCYEATGTTFKPKLEKIKKSAPQKFLYFRE